MKLALLIGIDYIGTSSQLYGCINDTANIKSLLVDHYDYKPENITILTDHTDITPTRDNILTQLYNLLQRVHAEEVTQIFISYSGHGTNTRDTSGDEVDGMDEMIVPLDFKCISDDHLCHIIRLLQEHCNVFSLFDCCHSGTILDLECIFTPSPPSPAPSAPSDEGAEGDDATTYGEYKTVPNHADIPYTSIMISGCRDDQYSQECWVGEARGAMTTLLVYLLQSNDFDISYERLVYEMNGMLKLYSFVQVPLLSTNKEIDLSSQFSL
jgi:hypothetical protein